MEEVLVGKSLTLFTAQLKAVEVLKNVSILWKGKPMTGINFVIATYD